MPDLSFNLTLPDHLAKALVNGVPTADLDAAVKVVKEQVRPKVELRAGILRYDGFFPLGFLLADERVSADNGKVTVDNPGKGPITGSCVITGPGYALRVRPGDVVRRGGHGRPYISGTEIRVRVSPGGLR